MEWDQQNLDNTRVTILYDINGVTQPEFTIDAPMETIISMSLEQIRDFIIARVAEERGTELWTAVQSKLNPYINADLEE